MWDRLKVRLCLAAALVTLASACTDSGGDVESTQAARKLMGSALGTQAVQDFLVHLDLSIVVDDELVSVMDRVREQSRAASGAPMDLAGGMQLSPVEGLEAWATDSAGEGLETVSVDFGLLDITEARSEEVRASIAASVTADSPASIPDDLFDGEQDGALLVQIISASYEEAWTHVGPDDSVAFDASFLASPGSASEFLSVHVFGQTLPGDPRLENGLTPHELFAYRWNNGLVRLVGDENRGPHFVGAIGAYVEGAQSSSSRPRQIVAAGLLGAAALPPGAQVFAESESPDQDSRDTPATPSGTPAPESPATVRFNAKTVLRTLIMSQGYRAGSEIARSLMEESTNSGGRPVHVTPSGLPSDGLGSGHTECFRTERARSAGKVSVVLGTPNEDGGCDMKFTLAGKGYEILWAMRWEHLACVFATAMARRLNDPSSGKPASAGSETSTTATTDPLFDTTTTIPDLPPCNPPVPATAGGGTVGDVHMVTFDGEMYDNQAAGEFLVFESGDAVVQMRTEPWPLSDVASVVTAVAARVGDSRVSMHEGGATFVDGAGVTLERGTPVELGSGSLLWTGVGWVVVGPSGTEVHVADNLDVNGTMHIIVHPKGDEPTGMLGTVNGDKSDDLVTRGGEVYPELEVGDTERFYSSFIDSWRITEDESFFHYGDGESTAGFQREDFPARWIDFGDLDQVAKGDAEAVCRESGVTRPDLLAACIYDIVVTGDPGFAYDAFVFQVALLAPKDRPAPTSPFTSTPPPSGGNFLTIGGQTFAFEGFAAPGSCSISEDSPGTSLPGFLGEAITVDAAGRDVAIRIEFYALDDPFLVLTVLRDGRPYAWMWEGRPESGSVDEASLAGNSLTITGTAFLNDPEDPELHPMIPLPDGAETTSFRLQATCDR